VTFFDYPTGDGGAEVQEGVGQAFWPDAPEQDWTELLRLTMIRRLGAGETLIAPGTSERSVFIVLEGQFEVLAPTGRKWRRLATVGAGSVVGEQAFLDGFARSALARSLTDSSVAELTRTDFASLSRTNPQLALCVVLDLARIVSLRLRQAQGTS
jgi:CRP-like cAMP-binding protein